MLRKKAAPEPEVIVSLGKEAVKGWLAKQVTEQASHWIFVTLLGGAMLGVNWFCNEQTTNLAIKIASADSVQRTKTFHADSTNRALATLRREAKDDEIIAMIDSERRGIHRKR